MAELTISKSQKRAAKLLDIAHDGTYASAAAAFEARLLPADGLGSLTWREAAKLSDAELKLKLAGHADPDRFETIDRY